MLPNRPIAPDFRPLPPSRFAFSAELLIKVSDTRGRLPLERVTHVSVRHRTARTYRSCVSCGLRGRAGDPKTIPSVLASFGDEIDRFQRRCADPCTHVVEHPGGRGRVDR